MTYCSICGGKINPGEDRCSNCGAPVQSGQSSMQEKLPGYQEMQYQQNQYQQENTPVSTYDQTEGKKGKKTGKRAVRIAGILLMVFLLGALRAVVEFGLTKWIDSRDSVLHKTISGADATGEELFAATEYGALLQGNRLYYGPIMVDLPGFELYQDEDGQDWLIDENGDNLLWTILQEENSSYRYSDEEGILQSWYADEAYDSVESVRFEKFYLDEVLPAVLYTVLVTDAGASEPYYYTEAIVMDGKEPKESVRIELMSFTDDGYETAYAILRDLHVTDKNVAKSGLEKVGTEAITEVY